MPRRKTVTLLQFIALTLLVNVAVHFLFKFFSGDGVERQPHFVLVEGPLSRKNNCASTADNIIFEANTIADSAETPHVLFIPDNVNEAANITKAVLAERQECYNMTRIPGACPCMPPLLKGRMKINITVAQSYSWADTAAVAHLSQLKRGGTWQPSHCTARTSLLVIVPFRDRERHLRAFVAHMHPVLQRQQASYRILVIEQRLPQVFNKAATMNAGFAEAVSRGWEFDCVVFHDVDLLIEDDRNILRCGNRVRHYGKFIDRYRYKALQKLKCGGIVAFTKDQFMTINGFSNRFFGWGGEDDNVYERIVKKNLKIVSPSNLTGKYASIGHRRDKWNPAILRKPSLISRPNYNEGLSSVSYTVYAEPSSHLFTHIIVDLNVNNLHYEFPPRIFHFFSTTNYDCLRKTKTLVSLASTTKRDILEVCLDKCSELPDCSAVTIETKDNSACQLKDSSCWANKTPAPMSAIYLKGIDLKLEQLATKYVVYAGDCWGSSYKKAPLSSAYKCALECDETKKCVGFVISLGNCYFKTVCHPTIGPQRGRKVFTYVKKLAK